jgi:hypothetical protein
MWACCLLWIGLANSLGVAAEYQVEVLDEAAPADDLSDSIAQQLSAKGLRVQRGTRTVCELWTSKQWDVAEGFEATTEVLYPFEPGQLIGVIRFKQRGHDFRDQRLSRGLYTLRYAQQPSDGNHEGTSPTRDLLLLVQADQDKSPEPMDVNPLLKASAEAAGSSHPAMLCLRKVEGGEAPPSLRHDADRDWWILRLASNSEPNGGVLPVDLVVVGHADE